MGALKVGIFVFLVLIAVGGYIATHPSVLKNVHFQTREIVWTNNNFSKIASSPQGHGGEKVDLKVLVFNIMPKNGRINQSAVEMEAYMGNAKQLQASPMDTSKRIYISYDPGMSYNPTIGTCIEVKGTIAGQVSVTTLDGSKVYPVYIKANSITPISCNSLK